jgi:glucan phosphoethanolaminetransferase (alkaline phosphatase superfamily)
MSREPSPHTRAPVGQSALSLLFATLVAAVTYLHFSGGLFCTSEEVHGANIAHSLGVAFVAGLGGSVLVLCVRNRRRLLAAVLVLGSVAIGVAIALVALDSATYTAQRSCGLFTDTETALHERVYYLYVLWGVPLALLLRSTVRALRRMRDEVERTSSGAATPSPRARETDAIGARPLTEAERAAALDAARRVRPHGP